MAELPTVRIAQRADEEELMAMCRRLHRENGVFEFDDDKVRSILHKCFDRTGAIVGVIGEPGHIEASICLMISNLYYTADWHLDEFWNFVDADYRRSHNAEALVRFAKDCADKMHIPLLIGIITNRHMAGKVRLYRRLLGSPTGAFFLYNSNWKSEPMESHNDLRLRLKEFARICNDTRVSVKNRPAAARLTEINNLMDQLSPLLKEAAEAIGTEDNMWGTIKTNGATVHVGQESA